jgi:hypothetical protein
MSSAPLLVGSGWNPGAGWQLLRYRGTMAPSSEAARSGLDTPPETNAAWHAALTLAERVRLLLALAAPALRGKELLDARVSVG